MNICRIVLIAAAYHCSKYLPSLEVCIYVFNYIGRLILNAPVKIEDDILFLVIVFSVFLENSSGHKTLKQCFFNFDSMSKMLNQC